MGKQKKKNSKKKYFIFGGIGVVIIILVVLVITNSNNEKIISVQTEKVEKRNITQVVSATGKIFPEYQVELRPEVTGEVVELPVIEGDIVKKGQLLIRMKPEQYIAQLDRAKASLQSAKAMLTVSKANLDKVESDYGRVKGLFAKELASEQELEAAKSNYLQSVGQYQAQEASVLQAQASLSDSQEQLDKTVMYSPINGRITALNVELSERVLGSSFSQGTLLMTVADLGKMEARVEVDENDVVLISEGDTTNIEIDAFGDEKFKGLVTQIGNSAQTTGLGTQDEVVNFEVRIRLISPNEKIRPGMSCDADIQTETKLGVISVPIQSVTARMKTSGVKEVEKAEEGDEEQPKVKNGKREKPEEVVFLLEGNEVKKVNIETGISNDTYIEIKSGLEGGEEVVNGPYRAISKELEDGTKVMAPKKDDKKADLTEEKKKELSQK
ncbi:MAG: efflux RND transporter periplasmic adaptor subunit [Bacteroidetes bacterium]|nr:efflux RND transporter periplasmic adaptor subunit [Bacteroidota bacterium]MBU1114921.1 efflux RND transporter periplasmic adaptor subunit [Bacteroidota bacterium]MBU1798396.1 efflux RND transporter periplasmic adaptor subunit [Bacteroidota bacterium]